MKVHPICLQSWSRRPWPKLVCRRVLARLLDELLLRSFSSKGSFDDFHRLVNTPFYQLVKNLRFSYLYVMTFTNLNPFLIRFLTDDVYRKS